MPELTIKKPTLKTPFPNMPKIWTCPKTGLKIPKGIEENIKWRQTILEKAEKDPILQSDLLAACNESLLFWVNGFVWTYHQNDIDPKTGRAIPADHSHNPFLTWEIQDTAFGELEDAIENQHDILFNKSRDMGASWVCIVFLHKIWLFRKESQLLEMSRTEDYVDKPGNHKSLFWKHDYINKWLPEWMRPEDCLPGQKNRTRLHMKNSWNNSVIDGESTTEHAGSGDRRLAVLLDEFAKVQNGMAMRSATADVSHCRIINSTPAGAATEYSRWKNSGQIKVFWLPFWEHPEKGKGRYADWDDAKKNWKIRSLWYNLEEDRRSPKEMAQEIDMEDIESGSAFFSIRNVESHKALFARDPECIYSVKLKKNISNDAIPSLIKRKEKNCVKAVRSKNGELKIWCQLIDSRPDQTKTYVFGIDVSKGQGASNSVISIKCRETGEKIAEWKSATVPPYELARVAIALAIWCGGGPPKRLPFMKWEMNGPGWDFGKLVVKDFQYPYYYVDKTIGNTVDRKTKKYGWHSNTTRKFALLSLYDRFLANGGYINHSIEALEEMKMYVHHESGYIGPAELVEKGQDERATHGDIVIADALTLEEDEFPKIKPEGAKAPFNSCGYRRQQIMKARKEMKNKKWRKRFDFSKIPASTTAW